MSADTASWALIADRHYGPCKEQVAAQLITIPKTNSGAAGVKALKFHDPEGHPHGSLRHAFSLCPR
jgi:hypothetical protein